MEIAVSYLGLTDFKRTWHLQKILTEEVSKGLAPSALIICQHRPVITLGRLAKAENLLFAPEDLTKNNIALFKIDRGGDITYHGPGQLIAYPILNLTFLKKNIHWFLRQLEEVIIDFLSRFSIHAERKSGYTGVWVGEKKIASIGIAIRHWVSFHGLSINISQDDLANFRFIRPCGMDIRMTSVETILGNPVTMYQAEELLEHSFRDIFPMRSVPDFRLDERTSLLKEVGAL